MTQSAKTIKSNAITDIISATLSGISGTPKVSSITYPGDDTAAAVDGGQTITLNGSGFNSGATVLINNTVVSVVTVVNSTTITFTSPALSVGSYILYVINTDGGTGISIPGIQYSGTPAWTTSAGSLGSQYETTAFNNTLSATGDAPVTYSLTSGSLPTGATLNANGTITGTSVVGSGSPTTYTFTVSAIDAQNQDTQRQFSITINPDSVTWVNPASDNSTVQLNGSSYSMSLSATSAANNTVTYSANALPTGLTLSNGVISGISTVEANTATLLTATASNTNRTATRTINWTVSLGDAYWKYTSLVLTGTTPTTTFINDASLNNHQLTIQGDTKPNNFNPYSQGYYSVNLSDSVARCEYNQPALGNSFTIEFWVYPTVAGSNNYIYSGGSTTGPLVGYNGSTFSAAHQGAWTVASSSNPALFAWSHIALVREGTGSNQFKLYINGVLTGTGTDATTFDAQSTGSLGGNTSSAPGYVSNFRIVNNQALYTGTFTPPTAPLTTTAIGTSGANVASSLTGTTILLIAQSPRFVDKSTNNLTITPVAPIQISSAHPFTPNPSYNTYGSAYFDGTGDYLVNTGSTAMTFGMGDFTVEYWVYPTAFTGTYQSHVGAGTTSNGLAFGLDGSNRIYKTTLSVGISGSTALVANRWYHIAWTRSSGTARGFINGVQDYSGADATNVTETSFGIGGAPSGTLYPCGASYICDIRVVKGFAQYTSNFTPPTAPLTAVPNTSLLTLQYNGGSTNSGIVDQSSFNNTITRAGNVTQGTFSPYSQTGWSNYFDGTGDYLNLTDNVAFQYGTGDFTIEFWFYMQKGGVQQVIYDQKAAGGQIAPTIFVTSSDYLLYDVAGVNILGATLTVGLWYHVAVSRVSSSTMMFLNGTQVGTTLADSRTYINGTARPIIGVDGSNTANYNFNGYVSNVRVIKGTGLYSVDFTPSTSPLTPIAKTSLLICQSNRINDNSPNNFTITKNGDTSVQAFSPFGGVTSVPTSYSNYFDGSGDYLQMTEPTATSGNVTVECWVYPTSTAVRGFVFSAGTASSQGAWGISIAAANTIEVWIDGFSGAKFTSALTVPDFTWSHLALVKTSGVVRLYVNGTLDVGSFTQSGNFGFPTASSIFFGLYSISLNQLYTGYISNFRYVQGTALYSGSTITVPTSPLTAISGTAVLTCQSSTIIDNSSNNYAITSNGDTKPLAVNPFGQTTTSRVSYTPAVNGGSMYFDGTGDYLTTPGTPVSFGTNPYTIEFWIYRTAAPTVTRLFERGTGTTDFSMDLSTSGSLTINNNTTIASSTATITIPLNAWTHVALVRKSTSASATAWYINGAPAGTYTHSTNVASGGTLYIASSGGSSYFLTGYLSDLKITNGTAIYSSGFYPGLAPTSSTVSTLLLTGTSGGIVDYHSSINLETVGNTQLASEDPYSGSYYSLSLNSQGYLTTPANAALDLATASASFTLEAWVYFNAYNSMASSASVIAGNFQSSNGWFWGWYGVGTISYLTLTVYPSGTSSNFTMDTTTIPLNKWIHVATVNNAGTLTTYINGTAIGATPSYPGYTGSGGQLAIGVYQQNLGYSGNPDWLISNLRITKGQALYTSAFTPSTAPLTTTSQGATASNVSLLTAQSKSFKDNSNNNFVLTRNTAGAVKSLNPFQQNTGKSLYFDGTGDWMQLPITPNLYLGSGNFTIEGWIYVTSTDTTFRCIYSVGNTVQIYARNGTIEMYFNDSDDTLSYMLNGTTGPASSIVANSWTHFAVVRIGTSWTAFVNGVAGTTVTAGGAIANSATKPQVGAVTSIYPFSGYIKDLRITKGYARYTTGFTPAVTAVTTS